MNIKDDSSIPPFKITRNVHGLINNGSVNYLYNTDGTVDWRHIIPRDYLVPNKIKTVETDVSKLQDKDILIVLRGIRWLAQVRGYNKIEYDVIHSSEDYVLIKCKITFIPNFETENKEITFESFGDASKNNTESFGKLFLAACAENRAFARCVRNFLNLGIIAEEEMQSANPLQQTTNNDTPVIILKQLMSEYSYTFEKIKEKLIASKVENAEKFEKEEDIPNSVIFDIINKINKKKKKES